MTPADICNRALDSIGHTTDKRIGDLQEGSRESIVLLRHYGAALRQILRAVHWNFARTQSPLTLLNDATGQTTAAQIAAGQDPVTVGTGTVGQRPWIYEYAWPVNAVKARFVPVQMYNPSQAVPGNISLPSTPPMTGMQSAVPFARLIPARFTVAQDFVPNLIGVPAAWSEIPDTSQTMGQALAQQTVILTNQPNATLVYTSLMTYPDQWDPLFSQAFIALLASLVAASLIDDVRARIAVRDDQIKVAKMALEQARITDGNEGNFSLDHVPDWIRVRNGGSRWGGGLDAGPGVYSYGWDAAGFPDGSSF